MQVAEVFQAVFLLNVSGIMSIKRKSFFQLSLIAIFCLSEVVRYTIQAEAFSTLTEDDRSDDSPESDEPSSFGVSSIIHEEWVHENGKAEWLQSLPSGRKSKEIKYWQGNDRNERTFGKNNSPPSPPEDLSQVIGLDLLTVLTEMNYDGLDSELDNSAIGKTKIIIIDDSDNEEVSSDGKNKLLEELVNLLSKDRNKKEKKVSSFEDPKESTVELKKITFKDTTKNSSLTTKTKSEKDKASEGKEETEKMDTLKRPSIIHQRGEGKYEWTTSLKSDGKLPTEKHSIQNSKKKRAESSKIGKKPERRNNPKGNSEKRKSSIVPHAVKRESTANSRVPWWSNQKTTLKNELNEKQNTGSGTNDSHSDKFVKIEESAESQTLLNAKGDARKNHQNPPKTTENIINSYDRRRDSFLQGGNGAMNMGFGNMFFSMFSNMLPVRKTFVRKDMKKFRNPESSIRNLTKLTGSNDRVFENSFLHNQKNSAKESDEAKIRMDSEVERKVEIVESFESLMERKETNSAEIRDTGPLQHTKKQWNIGKEYGHLNFDGNSQPSSVEQLWNKEKKRMENTSSKEFDSVKSGQTNTHPSTEKVDQPSDFRNRATQGLFDAIKTWNESRIKRRPHEIATGLVIRKEGADLESDLPMLNGRVKTQQKYISNSGDKTEFDRSPEVRFDIQGNFSREQQKNTNAFLDTSVTQLNTNIKIKENTTLGDGDSVFSNLVKTEQNIHGHELNSNQILDTRDGVSQSVADKSYKATSELLHLQTLRPVQDLAKRKENFNKVEDLFLSKTEPSIQENDIKMDFDQGPRYAPSKHLLHGTLLHEQQEAHQNSQKKSETRQMPAKNLTNVKQSIDPEVTDSAQVDKKATVQNITKEIEKSDLSQNSSSKYNTSQQLFIGTVLNPPGMFFKKYTSRHPVKAFDKRIQDTRSISAFNNHQKPVSSGDTVIQAFVVEPELPQYKSDSDDTSQNTNDPVAVYSQRRPYDDLNRRGYSSAPSATAGLRLPFTASAEKRGLDFAGKRTGNGKHLIYKK